MKCDLNCFSPIKYSPSPLIDSTAIIDPIPVVISALLANEVLPSTSLTSASGDCIACSMMPSHWFGFSSLCSSRALISSHKLSTSFLASQSIVTNIKMKEGRFVTKPLKVYREAFSLVSSALCKVPRYFISLADYS